MQAISLENAPKISPVVVMGEPSFNNSNQPENILSYEEFLSKEKSHEPENQSLGGPMFYTSGTTGHLRELKARCLRLALLSAR